jgi:hypothetical protein
MFSNYRDFQAGPDPFGRMWTVQFLWQQNAISIRHADTIDCKFVVEDGVGRDEKVVAVPHPLLLKLSAASGQPVSDPWVSKLAAAHLNEMISTGEDIEKTLVTMTAGDLDKANAHLATQP